MASMIERLATQLLSADGTYDARANSYPAERGGYAVAYAAEGLALSGPARARNTPREAVRAVERWLLERSPDRYAATPVLVAPRHARFDWFGSWTDTDGTIYLDVIEILWDEGNARALASARGELAIWSFADSAEIRVAPMFEVIGVAEAWCNHDAVAVVKGVCECGAKIDTESSASRQHFIDTGRYLAEGEAL